MSADAFPFWESNLHRTLGLKNRARIRELRAALLVEGVDFKREKKRVVYSQAGLDNIRAALSLTDEKSAPASSGAHPEPPPELVTLLVWKPQLVNQKMILAYPAGAEPLPENIVRVRVKTAENFVRFVNGKPMELKARHVQADLYELATPCPRWKGRW